MFEVLRMQWRDLLFASWPVDARQIAGKLPAGLKPDHHHGKAWVTIVAFKNRDLRARGLPQWAGFDLPELNLRTYVTHKKEPGIFFLSMDADGIFSVAGASIFFQLPYYRAKIDMVSHGGGHRFESQRRHLGKPRARFRAQYRGVGEEQGLKPGSLDEFLLERYRLYTSTPFGLAHLEVEHEPWRVQDADVEIEENTLFKAAGLRPSKNEPVCHFATGREVSASPLIPR